MARNGVHTGGRTKARYYKVWDKENGKYKGGQCHCHEWRGAGG